MSWLLGDRYACMLWRRGYDDDSSHVHIPLHVLALLGSGVRVRVWISERPKEDQRHY